jgi:type IX secretion system PorP/SprF family membrane protein
MLLCGQLLHAQLEPLSNQYLLNTLAINPAYAGSREALSITLLHRNQWTGFEGAPRTETVAMHAPMRKQNVGLGLLVMNDRVGVSGSKVFLGNFAYRIHAGNGVMALGIGGGVSVVRNSWNELVAVDPDDQLLYGYTERYVLPDFSLGLYYNSPRFFLGFSMPLFLTHRFNAASGTFDLVNDFSRYNYFLNTGALLNLSERWTIMPSLMLRFKQETIPQADLNLYVDYDDRIWLGISYRTNNSIIGTCIIQVNHQLSLAYSYDTGFGRTGRSLGGSHEIMLRYDFRYIADLINPRYF